MGSVKVGRGKAPTMLWGVTVAASVLLVLLMTGGQRPRTEVANLRTAVEWLKVLLHEHPYLLRERVRPQVEELAGQLQALLSRGEQRPQAPNPALLERSRAVMERLLPMLERGTTAYQVRIREDRVEMPLSLPSPWNLPGSEGGLLLRVESEEGEDAIGFALCRADLRKKVPFHLPLPARSTWVLLAVAHAPVGESTVSLLLEQGEARGLPLTLMVRAPQPGEIVLNLVDEESGLLTPAMVSAQWVEDGQVRIPEGAVDLSPQWDTGPAGVVRSVRMAHRLLSRPYVCVAGQARFVGPPGRWQIFVRRGIEFEPVSLDLTVAPGERVERRVPLRRWVNMAARGWYSGDDHVHAGILSDEDARRLLLWARAEDTHVVNVLKMGDINRTWFEQRGFGTKYRAQEGDYWLVPGQECPRTHQELGHTIANNNGESMVRDTSRYFLYDYMFDNAKKQGATTGYAHVNSGAFFIHRAMSLHVPFRRGDFVEVLQFGNLGTGLWYEFLNLGYRLTASAGSDVPWGGSIGEARLYAYLGPGRPLVVDEWYRAVERGRTFVTNGPMLEFTVNDALPGDEIQAERGTLLRLRAVAFGHPRLGAPQRLEIVKFGEVIASQEAREPDQTQLALEIPLYAEDGFWLAARCQAADGTSAHTSPIWVIRPGLRPWKYAEVETLLSRRLASLAEIEQLYEVRRGNPRDPWVQQWPEIRRQVEAARAEYARLRDLAKQEAALRGGP